MGLSALRIKPGKPVVPTAAQHNRVLDHLLRNRILGVIEDVNDPAPYKHPFRVRTSRFDDIPGAWRVDIAAGWINDELPTIVYLLENDPRGWKPPSDFVLPKKGEPGYNAKFIERDALDDPDDPACLILRDPTAKTQTATDFTIVPDNIRNGLEAGTFTGADSWELELWRAHVILTAMPATVQNLPLIVAPPELGRYRFTSLRVLPDADVAAADGGWLELATLYLLRDPQAPDDAQLLVRQREFWPMWAQIVQPGSDLAGLLSGLGDTGDESQSQIDATIADTAYVEFWTV